ncbi:HAD family hydrolase [Aequorivita echinoideorum]|uniref:HAD family phosphatase n=1 Tax=Aequorivita echinoideorum TaxID=1549647 RepID=A0ABS5S0I8_9FLAO|nr:HAD family phosphatase [Aequorivita echinoideorum]MBT0606721.1 HAD family phosphatase [Aequorivita echinoideorum]
MLKAVIFDMDGVIVDTEPLHKKAYHNMFSDVEIEVNPVMYEGFTGQSTENICKFLCSEFQLSRDPSDLMAIKRKHFKYLFENDAELSLLDGVLPLIQNYYNHGMKLVLASSASMPNINSIFKRFDLDKYFIAKLSGADLKESKPHPEIFIKAAQVTGFSTGECIVIEDSTNGIEAAKAAGIFCVGYNSLHSKNQDYGKADLVIQNFSEIEYDKISHLV